jgi:hypothetical protein
MDGSSEPPSSLPSNMKGTKMSNERIEQRPMRPRPAKVVVKFDQQQRKLLDFLRAEGKFGTEDGEIIRNVVLDYLKQQQKRGKR